MAHPAALMTLSSPARYTLLGAALSCGIILLVSAALPPERETVLVHGLEFARWEQGQPPVKLIRSNEGYCALTMVRGHFAGGGEHVRVWVDEDGFWYLGGHSYQHEVSAECVIVRYRELAGTIR